MARPPTSIWRRVRAHQGRIALLAVWSGAATLCLVLGAGLPRGGARAVAVVRQHPVLPCDDGRVQSLDVQPGQAVTAGQILATVEVPGLAQELASADADVRALEAELALDGADLRRKFARDEDAAHARVLAAEVALHAARGALSEAEQELSRSESGGVQIAEVVLASLRARAEAARAEVTARESELRGLEEAWTAARARGAPGDAGAPSIEAARAARDALAARLDACTLRAPSDGVVGAPSLAERETAPVALVPGQWVTRGAPLLVVTEPVVADLVAYVEPARARALRAGAGASLNDADGRALRARVVAVGAAVEPVPLQHAADPATPQWGVPVTLVAEDAALTPGEPFEVAFDGDDGLLSLRLPVVSTVSGAP